MLEKNIPICYRFQKINGQKNNRDHNDNIYCADWIVEILFGLTIDANWKIFTFQARKSQKNYRLSLRLNFVKLSNYIMQNKSRTTYAWLAWLYIHVRFKTWRSSDTGLWERQLIKESNWHIQVSTTNFPNTFISSSCCSLSLFPICENSRMNLLKSPWGERLESFKSTEKLNELPVFVELWVFPHFSPISRFHFRVDELFDSIYCV